MVVVVVGVDVEHVFKVAATRDQEPVEALSANGADETLGDCVRFRRSYWRLDDADAFAGEDGVEVAGEFAVAVADQEAEPPRLRLQCPGELARLLGDPGSVRVGGAAGEVNAAASDFDEEEYVEAPQRDRLDGEEVDGEHALRLLPQECAPGESAAPACRREACLLEDLPNSSRRHPEAEPVDLACDPL